MKRVKIILILLFWMPSFGVLCAQENANNDAAIKDSLYNANKRKVLNYSLKEFDALFLEFFEKKRNPDLILSKEEFYDYTVKIALFSDRLAKLYPKEKEVAAENKKKWLSETYQDYLISKPSTKK